MNVERLTEIAEWLEAGAPEVREAGIVCFDMGSWSSIDAERCGTICCIGGYAQERFGASVMREPGNDDLTYKQAGQLLGLSRFDAWNLFQPPGIEFEEINSSWAARTIRHLLATGTVDWNATREAV